MADIITLDEKKFKSVKELLAYSNAQFIALQAASDKIKNLEQEVTHLQLMLAETVPLVGDSKVEIYNKSLEQSIIEAQITIISNRALQKELTLEEIKALDLLIKNKKICEETKTLKSDNRKKKDYTEAELIQKARLIEDK